jgi:dihydrofolate reductase
MKLTLHAFLSVDGVMQGPGGFEEDRSGGFDRGGWLVPYADQDMGEIVTGWFAEADAILLGRTTYDMMSAFWSQVTDPDDAVAAALNTKPKYVASTTLRNPSWANTSVLVGDVLARVRRLKEREGASCRCTAAACSPGRCTRPGSWTSTG